MCVLKFKFYSLKIIFLNAILISALISCRHEDDISALPEVCFESDVLPIFQNSCAISGCHDGSGEFNLGSYNAIVEHVSPGNPQKSKVYTVLSNVWSVESMMPPDQPLSIENRAKIKIWIEQGAKNTSCNP